jgi:hypothetical protein
MSEAAETLAATRLEKEERNARWGPRVLFVFGLPFLLSGLWTASTGLQRLSEEGVSEETAVACLIGALFTLVGAGVLFWARHAQKRLAETQQLRRMHPAEPWRWRPEWREGRIAARDRARVVVLWLATLVWNGMSAPLVWSLPRQLEREPLLLVVAVVFPLAGLGILASALRATLRHRRFGTPTLHMDTFPGVIGGQLRGTIHVRGSLVGSERVGLRLTCVNRVTSGSGKSRSTFEHVRWQEEHTVSRSALAAAPIGSAIPVEFTLPSGLKPSSTVSSNNEIIWRLEANAALSGADFETRFEVPVFVTSASASNSTRSATPEVEPGGPTAFGDTGIRAEPLPEGGHRVDFPRLRQPAAGLAFCAFGATFAAVGVAVGTTDFPSFGVIFTLVFGGVGLLLLWAGLHTLLATTTVCARSDGLAIQSGILFRPRRFVPAQEIARITLDIGMQVGDRAYYDLKLHTRSGRKHTAGSSIRSKREAEWLADLLRKAVGLRS